MPIAFAGLQTDGGNNGGTTTTLTFAHDAGSGADRLLVVGVLGDDTLDNVTGVTYNGVAMTLAQKRLAGTGISRSTYIFFLVNPTSGSNNIVITSSSNRYLFGGAVSYTGVKATGQPDATTTNTIGGGTSITTSITTVTDNDWTVLIECGYNANVPPSAGTGAVRRVAEGVYGSFGIFDSNSAITPAGSYSMTTTRTSSSPMGHVLAAFAPVVGGAAAASRPVFTQPPRRAFR